MSLESVSIVPLKDVVKRVKVGFVGSCNEDYCSIDEGVPMIRTTNLTKEGVKLDNLKYVNKEFHEKNSKSQINYGDILIARHGNNGLASLWEYKFDAQSLNVVIVETDEILADKHYLTYLINSPLIQKQIKALTGGSVQSVVNTKDIADLLIPVPPLTKQKEIANFLSLFDEKIKVNKFINNNLESIAQTILNEKFFIFSNFDSEKLMDTDIGKIPKDWKKYYFKELFDHIKPGTNYQPKRTDHGIPFLNVKNINAGYIDLSDVKYISTTDFNKVHKSWIPEDGDILISRIGTLGLTTVINKEDLPLAVHYNFINVKSKKLPYQFVYFLFKSKNFQRKYHALKKHSVQEYVTIDDFSNIEIALPINLDQLKHDFNIFINIFNKIQENISENKKLIKLRDILLPKLMSGEIDVSKINCDLD